MKFITISDTHTKHNQIPLEWLEPADCIIHGGDVSSKGYLFEIQQFLEWFTKLDQYKYKIFIAGNHDFGFEDDNIAVASILKEYPNIIYLQDSGIELEGVKIYGSPWQPRFFNWAFNLDRGTAIKEKWDLIPEDTDILITHGPAYGECDWVEPRKNHGGEFRKFTDGGCVGCEDLLDVILNKVHPKVHISGHIHSSHGESFKGNTHFINASTLNERYEVQYNPIIFEI